VRVLYSFPHTLGAGRIADTAWYQVAGAAAAGGEMHVMARAIRRSLPRGIELTLTLSRGRIRLPNRIIGNMRAFALHDRLVARRLARLAQQIDVVHTWPLAALATLRTARRLGIPTVLERPNAHTRHAYEVVARESE